ncbi:MAG TPA: NAD(P)H-binding protein [Candidatus Dormibacteraeota bacterium]|nr:NAD(P)H-binding protein [Candidatus Dormibacteraeota bacterium]
MRAERVLVAGATGFIGRAVVRELTARGHGVRALYHSREPSFGEGVETVRGDVTDAATLEAAVEGCTAVVDTVQFPGSPIEQPRKGWTFERIDLGGVRNLLAHARPAGVERFVYLSGTNLSEDSPLPSHRAKALAERAIRESGIGYTFVKPSLVAGEGSRPVEVLASTIKMAPFIPLMGSGSSKVQPVYVGDVARLIADVLESPAAANRAIEIGGPEVLTMKELMLRLAALMGVRKPALPGPLPPLMLVAWLAELLPNPPLSRDAVRFLTLDVDVDNAALFEIFPGFALTPTDEALRRSLPRP